MIATAPSAPAPVAPAPVDAPIVIAHRGASAYRPEHTLAAYELAIECGADYIEPDVVVTRDGVLVARHENDITETTDVSRRPEFVGRRTAKIVDGVAREGWFTEDFTLEELKTLRAVERMSHLRRLSTAHDGIHEIPTLAEVMELACREGVGVYAETKHASYFRALGLPLEERLVELLGQYDLDRRDAPVFVQSFEPASLRMLGSMTRVRLTQLLGVRGRPYDFTAAGDERTYASLTTPEGLAAVARYADGIGPDKRLIGRPVRATGQMTATSLVDDAHAVGLLVHAYTFRPENLFAPPGLRAGIAGHSEYAGSRSETATEIAEFLTAGVDGIFADHPDTAVAVRARLLRRLERQVTFA